MSNEKVQLWINKTIAKDNRDVQFARNVSGWYTGMNDYFFRPELEPIRALLNDKKFTVKESGIPYRTINHWESENVIDNERESDGEWRRFSSLDLVWLKILLTMRDFGLGIATMRRSRQHLREHEFPHKSGHNQLEYYVAYAYVLRLKVYLVIFDDGKIEPLSEYEYNIAVTTIGITHHLVVSLNEILQEIFPNRDLKPIQQKYVPVNEQERELLAEVRSRADAEIRLDVKENKIKRIDTTEHFSLDKKTEFQIASILEKLLKSSLHQELVIVKNGNRQASVKRTTKRRLRD